jgi:hypothetical protein
LRKESSRLGMKMKMKMRRMSLKAALVVARPRL